MIHIEKLSKSYEGRTVVDGLDLHVQGGEIYALLGPNGAGKSTTVGCLLGFVDADAGNIRLAGSNLPPARAAVQHAAYIAENVALYERLTGVENVEFFMRLLGRKPRREEIEALWNAPACRNTRGTAWPPAIRKACVKKSASSWRWPRARRCWCSSSPRPASIRKPA